MTAPHGQAPRDPPGPVATRALLEGVVAHDAAGAVLHFNDRAAAVIGTADGALLALRDVRDEQGADVPDAELPAARALREGRDLRGVLLEVRDARGRRRWLSCNVALSHTGDGTVTGSTLAFLDVTDARRRERALTEAHAHFRAVFAGAPIGMAVLDLRGGVVSGNRALTDVIRRDAVDLVGTAFPALVHEEERENAEHALNEVLAGHGGARQLEVRLMRGRTGVWVQLDVTLLRDADDRPALGLVQVQDVSERRRDHAHLRHLADHDPLTGLLNRRGFMRELEQQAGRTGRYGGEGALLLVDLDDFKRVNDTLGHDVGDELLREVAHTIALRTRASDVVGRFGGDEFAVLTPHGDAEDAQALATALLEALRSQRAGTTAGDLRVTASIGVTTLDGGADADHLLARADAAMYDAKGAGRDGAAHHVASDSGRAPASDRLRRLADLREAMAQGRLRLLAQPIVRAVDGTPEMHELLLRMEQPDGRLLAPDAFLEMAERFDVVQELDRWVLGRACRLLGRARRQGLRLQLSVNLSGKSVGSDRLLEAVETELERHGADASCLVLELTETAAVAHIQAAREFATAAQALGCRLAIDDFGAGFGSFHYLKHLPFDFLKIDGEFVSGGPASRTDELIVDAVRDLAHGLGRRVVAEWVADARTRTWLAGRGIDLLQGHEVGRPVPVEAILPRDAVA